MQDGGQLSYSGISDSCCMFVYICLGTYMNYRSGMRPYNLRCPERNRDIGYRLRTHQKVSQACTGVRDPL